MTTESQSVSMPNYALRDARESSGLTQAELAEQIGVPDKFLVAKWEAGKHVPGPMYRRKLCEFFNKSPEELGFIKAKPLTPESNFPVSSREFFLPTLERGTDTPNLPRKFPLRLLLLALLGIVLVATVGAGGWWGYSQINGRDPRSWPTTSFNPNVQLLNVEVIQLLLLSHGYDVGCVQDPKCVDGFFGPNTLLAVKAFQQEQHLSATGVVDNQTWEYLVVISSTTQNPNGPSVNALQGLLNANDAQPHLQVDSIFGPQTQKAVVWFQQQHHLPDNGVATLDTWCLLVGGHITS